jgi:4-amino-4-deoxy-L-arabinose transferase-like glycosyltransferase
VREPPVVPLRIAAGALAGLWMLLFYPAVVAIGTEAFGRGGALVTVLACGVVAALPGPSRWLRRALLGPATPVFVAAVALLSAGISGWFAVGMLGGKVLALDCSVYLLQARAMAHGALGVPQDAPGLYQSSRFLFEGPDGLLYGVFPPGYPLFLAPFAGLGVVMLSGPFVAAGLVVAQYALARASGEDEEVARISLLLPLPCYARAIETADLLSHAFVALLAAVALAAAFRCRHRPGPGWGLLIGVCLGWSFCARMLDGLVLGAILAGVGVWLAWATRDRRLLGAALAAALAAAPFVGLVLVQQKASTGHWLRPSQSEFFLRSDHPPTCHRLGFGKDVGCKVEHPPERASFGDDGYTLDDALRVGGERASILGNDLLGFAPLLLLGLASLLLAPTVEALWLGAWWVGLALAYLLFYYGNAPVYGARHLFPVAPAAYILVARLLPRLPRRERGRLDGGHVAGGMLLALLLISSVTQIERWRRARWTVKMHQAARPDVHALAGQVRDAIVVTGDHFSVIAALDPWRDRGLRHVAQDDRAGLVELRRAHPTWKVFAAASSGLLPLDFPPLSPGLHVELELAWPSRVWPAGLALKRVETEKHIKLESSGGEALGVHVAAEGASAEISFDVLQAGTYRLWIEGIRGPFMGRYELSVDDHPLPLWEGYGPRYERQIGERSAPLALAAGRHRLRMRCVGRAPGSKALLALFDTLEGELIAAPLSRHRL